MTILAFLQELRSRIQNEYYFREQTLVWKDEHGDYQMYVTVILETEGWNRFDYPAFNYGQLPIHQDTKIIAHVCRMKEREISGDVSNVFLLDYTQWNTEYRSYKTIVQNAF